MLLRRRGLDREGLLYARRTKGMGTSRQANGIFHGAQTNGTRNSPTDLLQFIPDDHSNVVLVLVLVVLVRVVVVGRIVSFGVTIGRRGVRGDGRHG